jgi:hypothetical protein
MWPFKHPHKQLFYALVFLVRFIWDKLKDISMYAFSESKERRELWGRPSDARSAVVSRKRWHEAVKLKSQVSGGRKIDGCIWSRCSKPNWRSVATVKLLILQFRQIRSLRVEKRMRPSHKCIVGVLVVVWVHAVKLFGTSLWDCVE